MEDSVTYQATIEKGRIAGQLQEARRILIRHGTKKFQEPSEAVRQWIEQIDDLERLERLIDRVFEAPCWDDLQGDDNQPG